MRKKKKAPEVEPGKIVKLWPYLVALHKDRPDVFENEEILKEVIGQPWPAIHDKTHCPNCGRGMEINIYKADIHNALFLLAMGRAVNENLKKGLPFTEANKVHAPSLEVSNTVSKRITQCDYLGFVKQPESLRRTGYWVITSWGFQALRGDPVPAWVKYWNGKLIERSNVTVTLDGMFSVHKEQVANAIARRKSVRSDHVAEIGDYDPKEWTEHAGIMEGNLFGE